MGDPDFVKAPVTSLLDPKYRRPARVDLERATPSSQIAVVFTGHESMETTITPWPTKPATSSP